MKLRRAITLFSFGLFLQACNFEDPKVTPTPTPTEGSPSELPLAQSISDIDDHFVGAFWIGGSYTDGRIAFNPDGDNGNGSMFVSTQHGHYGVREVTIPTLTTDMSDINNLPSASELQGGVALLPKIPQKTWPDDPLENRIMSMHYHQGKLFVHSAVYYDAPGTDMDTTFRIESPDNLATSDVTGNFQLEGAQHLTRWTSWVPEIWQSTLQTSHLMGAGSGQIAILSRLSVGPTLFGVDLDTLATAEDGDAISTNALLDFSEANPLHPDFLNYGGASGGENNGIYTEQSSPGFGFIIPGTRTYAVLGGSGGHTPHANPYVGTMTDWANQNGTIFYKNADGSWTDDQGVAADGYKIYKHDDKGSFFWFFDLNEIADADEAYEPRPYAYGHYNNYFSPEGIPSGVYNAVKSGTWDEANQVLYLSLPYAKRTVDGYSDGVVVLAYDFANE